MQVKIWRKTTSVFCDIIISMVRLINDSNIKILTNTAYSILRLQEKFTSIQNYNYPEYEPCIFAMWHANQFLVHGINNREKLSILISNSIDGQIVADVSEKWGFQVIRGSSGKKGAIESTMQMITKLKQGENVAIMVDGPHGPLHKVKNGVIKIAQMSGAPIIPVTWYSPQKTFINLPSWDKMKTPLGKCNILNIYGEPIFVKPDIDEQEIQSIRENIKNQLINIDNKADAIYKEALSKNLWNN